MDFFRKENNYANMLKKKKKILIVTLKDYYKKTCIDYDQKK